MDKIQQARLIKLGQATIDGKLGHSGFNMVGWVSQTETETETGNECGTACCMIGGCPNVFPASWFYDDDGDPMYSPDDGEDVMDDLEGFSGASEFFGITMNEASALFAGVAAIRLGCAVNACMPYGMVAVDDTDRVACGNALLNFVKWKEAQDAEDEQDTEG